VSNKSAGCSFFIPNLSVSFYDNLPRFASSFSAECWAILLALRHIIHLSSNQFLTISDSQSTLYSITASPFDSNVSPLILKIHSLVYTLKNEYKIVQFLWVPGHMGIYDNERADSFARKTSFIRTGPFHKIRFSDVIPHYRKVIWKV